MDMHRANLARKIEKRLDHRGNFDICLPDQHPDHDTWHVSSGASETHGQLFEKALHMSESGFGDVGPGAHRLAPR